MICFPKAFHDVFYIPASSYSFQSCVIFNSNQVGSCTWIWRLYKTGYLYPAVSSTLPVAGEMKWYFLTRQIVWDQHQVLWELWEGYLHRMAFQRRPCGDGGTYVPAKGQPESGAGAGGVCAPWKILLGTLPHVHATPRWWRGWRHPLTRLMKELRKWTNVKVPMSLLFTHGLRASEEIGNVSEIERQLSG